MPSAGRGDYGRDMSEPETTTESAAHPPLPIVHDEAGDTPVWLPISGLCAFVVMALFVLWRASHPVDEIVPSDGATEPTVVVEAPAEAPAAH